MDKSPICPLTPPIDLIYNHTTHTITCEVRRQKMRSFQMSTMVAVCALSSVLAACASVDDTEAPTVRVAFTAAFAPISSVTVYDTDGEVVMKLPEGKQETDLPVGNYYVDIRDDYNNSVFSEDGRLMFVPAADGAELDLAPHVVPNIDVPLFAITVNINHEVDDGYGTQVSALHTTGPDHRGRLVWEAARAMVGPTGADGYTWSTSTTNASYAYVSEDSGAWSSLRSAYGTLVSCRNDNDTTNNYTPCSLTYGTDNVSQYVCQTNCGTYGYHGGQCKAFMNLVAYRSGVYHGTNWAWKTLPTDSWIASNTSLSTYATALPGDLLRKTTSSQHAVIIVRVISSSQIVVMDSNWVSGGDGYEKIGSHVLGYTGSGTSSDLGTYRVLNCVYAGTC